MKPETDDSDTKFANPESVKVQSFSHLTDITLPKMEPPPHALLPTLKRSQSNHSDSPTKSPPQKKAALLKVPSAIRAALETSKSRGILRFFTPSTRESHNEHIARQAELTRMNSEEIVHENSIIDERKKVLVRENARVRKEKERSIKKKREIQSGDRSPGGTKRKVNTILIGMAQ